MALIDLDKFVESLMWMWDSYKDNPLFKNPIFNDIKLALNKQGLVYKDGKIVKTQRRISAEAKESGYGEPEDEKVRQELLAVVNDLVLPDEQQSRFVDWLEKQGQKPAWSEEDEKMKDLIISVLEVNHSKGIFKAGLRAIRTEEIVSWLKSLKQRYAWKPSEEQMDAMQMAVSYFDYSWVSKEQKLLESLYKDLKKLTEG